MKTGFASSFAALGFLMLSGCMSSHEGATIDATAFNQPLPTIHIMPLIDARKDKSGSLDVDDIQRIRDLTRTKLGDMGYQAVIENVWQKDVSTTDQQVAAMNEAALSRLVPPETGVFLVLTVTDVTDRYGGVMASYSITATFTLIDRTKGAAIWKDVGTGSHAAGGIIASQVAEADKRIEAETGLVNTLSNLPKNKT